MKSILTLVLAMTASTVANAQSGINDTIQARELQEIVIEAPKVIHKPDMDVFFPSKKAVENSRNGVQLLSNLMIPSLSVSDVLGSITSGGTGPHQRAPSDSQRCKKSASLHNQACGMD